MWGDIAIAFLLAFIVAFMATPYTMKIAKKVGAVDVPKDQRRMHKRAIPKLGGPAVILGFLVSVIYLLIVMSMEHTINLFDQDEYGKKLLGMLMGIIIIAITIKGGHRVMGMTMTQKILAAAAGLEKVEAGQLIEAKLDLVLGNDITSPVATGSVVFAGEIYADRLAEAIPAEVWAVLPMIVPIYEKTTE